MRSLKLLGIAAPDPPGLRPIRSRSDGSTGTRSSMARDGLPGRSDRPAPARLGSPRRSPIMRSPRRSAITAATADRTARSPARNASARRCSPRRSSGVAVVIGLGRAPTFVDHTGQLVHAVGRLPGARHRRVRDPVPGRFRRRARCVRGDRQDACRDRAGAAQGRRPVARRGPDRAGRATSCSPISTSGGWSTSSATCQSANHLPPTATPAPRSFARNDEQQR